MEVFISDSSTVGSLPTSGDYVHLYNNEQGSMFIIKFTKFDLGCPSFHPSVIIWFPLNILRTVLYNLTKFCMCIDIDVI